MNQPLITEVQCIECAKWSPRDCEEGMARLGYGACADAEIGTCFAGLKHRVCAGHRKAAEDVVEARVRFLEKNVEHNRRPQGVRVDGPVGPHTQEET